MSIKKLSLWPVLFLSAIANSIYASSSDIKEIQPLTYVEKSLIQNNTWDCKTPLETNDRCNFSIELDLPWFDTNNQSSKPINQEIFNITYSMISEDKNEIKRINEYNEYKKIINEEIRKTDENGNNLGNTLELGVDASVLMNSTHLINIDMSLNSYTGGAHGHYATLSLFFDPKSGKKLSFKDILPNQEAFKKIAESFFRKAHKIPAHASINNADAFWFKNDTFALPDNILLDKEKLTLVYNPYEIASFAQGQIKVDIPLTQVKHLLNKKYID